MKQSKKIKKFSGYFKKKFLSGLLVLIMSAVYAQEQVVHGLITDESKIPISGANVTIKGTSTGTISDANDQFSLNVASADDVLVITFIGYQTIAKISWIQNLLINIVQETSGKIRH